MNDWLVGWLADGMVYQVTGMIVLIAFVNINSIINWIIVEEMS